MEHVEKWDAVPGIDAPFGSLSYSYDSESLQIILSGTRLCRYAFSELLRFAMRPSAQAWTFFLTLCQCLANPQRFLCFGCTARTG
jgi:hypothetical protein